METSKTGFDVGHRPFHSSPKLIELLPVGYREHADDCALEERAGDRASWGVPGRLCGERALPVWSICLRETHKGLNIEPFSVVGRFFKVCEK